MINFFRIAYKLLKNNMKIYGLYLMVLVVTVATYYNFVAIRYNDTYVKLAKQLQSASVASLTCGFVLIFTVVFFMWHANGFFLKQRQKEIGLYMLMGICPSSIGNIFAIESMMLGGLSLIIGLPIGIMFSKLFFMLLDKIMLLNNVEFPLTISFKAIVELIIVFTLIFIVLGFKNYRVVKKSQLINMLNASKKKNPVPKLNYIKGTLGVLLIAGGYIVGINVRQQELDLLIASMLTLVMVCLGTYLFFESFLSIVFSKLVKCKNIVYKNVRIISINNLFFRLNLNYRTLAMTAILAASTVTALSISLAFKQFADDNVIMESPYSFSYISNDIKIKDKVLEIIQESDHELIGVNEVKFCMATTEYLHKLKNIDHNGQAIITSYSQIEKTVEILDYKDRYNILEQLKPKENEAAFILNARTIASPIFVEGQDIKINGRKYTIKKDIKVPFTGNISKFGSKNVYVLLDSEYRKLTEGTPEITLNGVQITNQSKSPELIKSIAGIVPGGFDRVYPHVTQYVAEYYALEIFFFLGLIISMVFVLATFSTLYFKILSNAFMDKEQYTMLKKIGMSKKEVAKSVYIQVGIEFLLPVIIGIIHSVVAINMLEELVNVDFPLQMLSGIIMFVVVIMIFYKEVSTKYIKMVY